MTSSVPGPVVPRARRFATTRWSLILQTRHHEPAQARAALEDLCNAYWLPVYAFMRRQTRDVHEAQDLTQGFFASLLSHNALDSLTPAHGRFRSFLLAASKHFVCNEWDRKATLRRGGQIVLHSLDYDDGEQQLSHDLSTEVSPEMLFERRWALAMLDRVLNRLRSEYETADRSVLFDSLAEHLSGSATDESLITVAQRLQMNPEAVRVALHRLRKRYRQILRDEIAQTTNSPEEVDDEIRELFRALSS